MKTYTFKKTENGNYVACLCAIAGQQSSEVNSLIFDKDFNFLNTVVAHPIHSWVSSCERIAVIAGLEYNNISVLSETLKIIVTNNFKGYTSYKKLTENRFQHYLPPLGMRFYVKD